MLETRIRVETGPRKTKYFPEYRRTYRYLFGLITFKRWREFSPDPSEPQTVQDAYLYLYRHCDHVPDSQKTRAEIIINRYLQLVAEEKIRLDHKKGKKVTYITYPGRTSWEGEEENA